MYVLFVYREAVGSYAENQRITAVRKVYQRGVVNPMINIEAFWKDYCNFENVSSHFQGKGQIRIESQKAVVHSQIIFFLN